MSRFIDELKKNTPTVDMHYRIGMRVVKTAIAVGLCLVIAMFTGGMESVSISAVSAIVTIRPTHGDTVRTGIFRLLGTVIGGALGTLAVIIGLFLPYYNEGLFALVIPLMLILNLYLCNVLNLQDSCSISCVVTIIVAANVALDATYSEALMYTLMRLRDTLVGVTVASLMNVLPYYYFFVLKKRGKPEEDDQDSGGCC